VENAAQVVHEPLKIVCLLFQQGAHVHAGRSGAADGDDVLNLSKAQPEPAGALDEGEHPEHGVGVQAISSRCPERGRQDAPCLVDQERLAAESALGCYLADPQPLCHDLRLRLAPRGRVKRKVLVGERRAFGGCRRGLAESRVSV
jgi:hypothetical protein